MVIACGDNRVKVISIFGADQGEFFFHRNIANLVPPFAPDGDHHGTSAAIEYAVRVLRVPNLSWHSNCGGVKGCLDMCEAARALESKTSFVGRWIEMLRPKYEKISGIKKTEERLQQFEKQTMQVSLENLMTFP